MNEKLHWCPSGFMETQALYMGLFENRDQLLVHLQNHEIEAKVHYPLPLHLQPDARSLNFSVGTFPVAEWQASHQITLPVHQFVETKPIDFMVETIGNFYQ